MVGTAHNFGPRLYLLREKVSFRVISHGSQPLRGSTNWRKGEGSGAVKRDGVGRGAVKETDYTLFKWKEKKEGKIKVALC